MTTKNTFMADALLKEFIQLHDYGKLIQAKVKNPFMADGLLKEFIQLYDHMRHIQAKVKNPLANNSLKESFQLQNEIEFISYIISQREKMILLTFSIDFNYVKPNIK